MDMQMYNLVKNAMKEGKSAEDLVREINSMAATAKKELEPKEPIKKAYMSKSHGAIPNKVDKAPLITLLAGYFVQNGFNPDEIFDTENQYRDYIGSVIESTLKGAKLLEKTVKTSKEAGEDEFAMGLRAFGSLLADLI